MFLGYKGFFPIYPRCCKFLLGISRSVNLRQAPACDELYDARSAPRIYKETVREGLLGFRDPSIVEDKLTKYGLKITE